MSREFEEFFRDNYSLVYRTAYSVTGRRQDAEDVLQTIFLRLLRRGLSPDLKANASRYLYRAAINLSLNVVRARKNLQSSDALDDLPAPDQSSDPGDDRIRQALMRAVASLSPRAVEMLILRYEHDYTDAQIAKMLGTSRGVIAVTLYRARARLRKLMTPAIAGDTP